MKLKEGAIFHGILNTKDSHWGIGQTGIGLCKDGTVDISNNRPKPSRNGCPESTIAWKNKCHPTHRSLKCPYSAVYSFDKNQKDIWLYPDAEKNLPRLKKAICNLKGKHGITEKHKILSNTSRKEIGKVKDFCTLE